MSNESTPLLNYNPFDFANPVIDSDLFAGRESELADIRYYLEHAKAAPNPINVALLGERAAGKTSFLNMAENAAKELGFCAVRVDLDESDAESELAFFGKLFDNLIHQACQQGAFGGLHSKTYDLYLDATSMYEAPNQNDKVFFPFIFPIQYAKAQASGNHNIHVSDAVFRRDLATIRQEVGCPVVLLFDECNVLAENRIILEKVRNIFMNNPGYMLVLTGTPNLFPVINDIFSPIIRQFKRINIGEFKSAVDTQKCIMNPLEKISSNPFEVMAYEFFDQDVKAIHDLTGGRPYEIQLICHLLYKRVQEGRASHMNFDLSVIEEIKDELENSQEISRRPIFNLVSHLSKSDLETIALVSSYAGVAFDEIWDLEYILGNVGKDEKAAHQSRLERLTDIGLIERAGGGNSLALAGDEFDKMYLKYFARELGVLIKYSNMPLKFRAYDAFIEKVVEYSPNKVKIFWRSDTDLAALIENSTTVSGAKELLNAIKRSVDAAYGAIYYHSGEPMMNLGRVRFSVRNEQEVFWVVPKKPEAQAELEHLISLFESMAERADGTIFRLSATLVSARVPPFNVIEDAVRTEGPKFARAQVLSWHARELLLEYTQLSDADSANRHFELASRFSDELELNRELLNNAGYLAIKANNFEVAVERLEDALKAQGTERLAPLVTYNLAIATLMEGEVERAKELLAEASTLLGGEVQGTECLFSPRFVDGSWVIEEVMRRPLGEVIQTAEQALSNATA